MQRRNVTTGGNLLVLAAGLAGCAWAADPALLEMLMPDAQTVMWVDVSQAEASRAGQEMQAALDEAIPKWQEQLSGMKEFNWLGLVDELAIARRGGTPEDSAPLIAVRGSLKPDQVAALEAFADGKADYLGVPIVTSSGKVRMSVAFLDETHAVIGRTNEVEAAVRRQGSANGPPALLKGKLEALDDFDLWVISRPALPGAEKPARAGAAAKPFENAQSLRAGARFHGDFELFAEAASADKKDTAKLASGLRNWFRAFDKYRKNLGLEDADVAVKGRSVRVTMEGPDEGGRARTAARAAEAHATPPVKWSEPATPPNGMIRVQSSEQDMGTVLLPAKQNP